jgi:hypothetical protein
MKLRPALLAAYREHKQACTDCEVVVGCIGVDCMKATLLSYTVHIVFCSVKDGLVSQILNLSLHDERYLLKTT